MFKIQTNGGKIKFLCRKNGRPVQQQSQRDNNARKRKNACRRICNEKRYNQRRQAFSRRERILFLVKLQF